ncbi:MAG: alpha/beta hydrolase [Deltaproteobacteria bacterium]|nr:alpha/beta hydrolase [Deltaproteobacteria bacterium]
MKRDTGYLERDGERIYYEVSGDGPPLVLTHGAGGNHAVWFQQVPHFAESRRVVLWDQRGFGRSTARGGPNSPARATADLGALLDHLGIARADVVGQSMGGWAVLGLALAQPARVRSLVLADTPGGIDTPELRASWANVGRGAGFATNELGRHPAVAPDFFDRRPERAVLYQQLGGFGDPKLADVLPSLVAARHDAAALAKLACPVLLLVGEVDALFSPSLIAASAKQLPPACRARVVTIPRAGHSPYFEESDAWNRAVGEFLAGAG